MNKILFSIGPVDIYWYAVLIVIALIIGFRLSIKEAKKLKVSISYITDLIIYIIIFGIVGARLYYVIFNYSLFKDDLLSILKIWEGGLAIYGAVIAAIIVIAIYAQRNEFFFQTTDIFAPALILGQAIGRWGNFINQEAYGSVVSIDYLQRLHLPEFIIKGMYINGNYHHPTFLYESIFCLLGFILLIVLRNVIKNRRKGTITFIYFIWYGLVRFFVEGLRTDSLYWGEFRVSQIVSLILIIIGIIGLIVNLIKRSKRDLSEGVNDGVRL